MLTARNSHSLHEQLQPNYVCNNFWGKLLQQMNIVIDTFISCLPSEIRILKKLASSTPLQTVWIKIWGPKKFRVWFGSKLFDTLMVFIKEFFKKSWFWKKSAVNKKHGKLPSRQRALAVVFDTHNSCLPYKIRISKGLQFRFGTLLHMFPIIHTSPLSNLLKIWQEPVWCNG